MAGIFGMSIKMKIKGKINVLNERLRRTALSNQRIHVLWGEVARSNRALLRLGGAAFIQCRSRAAACGCEKSHRVEFVSLPRVSKEKRPASHRWPLSATQARLPKP